MKNLCIAVVIAASSVLSVSAQNTNPQRDVQLGVKGGVNFSTITGDDFNDLDSRTSFNAGLVAEIPITNRFSIQPEVFYSGQGFDIKEIDQDNVFDTDQNIEYQLDYIQVPILAKFYLVDGLSIEAGPQFGFKINEEIDSQPNSDGGDVDISNEDSSVKDFETSITGGLSYKFSSGFFISGRYTYGLTNLFDDDSLLKNVDAKNAVA
ncbi:porin family protein, partial [Oceanihabitans sediminis]|uniref:porin family protein n=1 Tax=Oceanihabitans sediminis TaxID=1812012 RepID=UPI00299E545E